MARKRTVLYTTPLIYHRAFSKATSGTLSLLRPTPLAMEEPPQASPLRENQEIESDNTSEVLDTFVFCGLILSTGLLWEFPFKAIANGGAYFLVIYLVAVFIFLFPLLHLELFVGQHHQSNVVKVFRSYGTAYQGFGIVVLILTFMSSQYSVQASYDLFAHIGNMLGDAKNIISCTSDRYKVFETCISLYDEEQCRNEGRKTSANITRTEALLEEQSYYHREGSCTPKRMQREELPGSLAGYYRFTISFPGFQSFHKQRLFTYISMYCIFAIIVLLKMAYIRILIASLYGIFVILFLSCIFAFFLITDYGLFAETLWRINTPESLLTFQTYSEAVRMVFGSGGVVFFGVMSAASFRSKTGNTFRLSFIMVISNIVISFLSFVATLSIVAVIRDKQYAGENIIPERIGYLTETIYYKMDKLTLALAYSVAAVIAKLLRFFALVMVVSTFIRDRYHDSQHQWSKMICALITTCIITFLVTSIRSSLELWPILHGLFPDTVKAYDFVLPTAMILIFVVFYGEFEYTVDISEVFPESDSRSFLIRPSDSVFISLYNRLPYLIIFMAVVNINYVEEYRKVTWIVYFVYRFLVYFIASIIVLSFLINLKRAWKKGEWSFLFSPTPEHPSYHRIRFQESLEQESITVPKELLKAIQSAENEEDLKTAPPPDEPTTDVDKSAENVAGKPQPGSLPVDTKLKQKSTRITPQKEQIKIQTGGKQRIPLSKEASAELAQLLKTGIERKK
ncbi:hypothetical protein RB195_008794 [Necator americanus]|uniref:Sodium:neurotransmitter symporter family protein n=1 Tax=Necator americanus TaxID=51031 RepID=A0ABR1CQF5_NECAM